MTLRTRLMLLYAIPFLLSGIVLVTLPLSQVSRSVPAGSTLEPGEAHDSVVDNPVITRLVAVTLVGLVVMVVVSILAGWWVAGRFLYPLRTITNMARDISASNLHRRLGFQAARRGKGDEFTRLAATLDALFERLETAFESQRRFVANASHELRTPLTAERTLLQVALADPDASVGSLRAACHDVLALGQAQERLIDALLTLAASERGIEHREPVDLAGVAADVAAARDTGALRFDTDLTPADTAGDPGLVEILVTNLVENAMRHNVPGGRVEITTAMLRGRAYLSVGNTGPVIPGDEVERLFEPFQRLGAQRTAQRSGTDGGHGLGLAIVRAIATAHGAVVTANPAPDGGLTVTVLFP